MCYREKPLSDKQKIAVKRILQVVAEESLTAKEVWEVLDMTKECYQVAKITCDFASSPEVDEVLSQD